MAWIESHTVVSRHRKLIAMAAELRIKPVHLVGHFHVLWHAALEQQEDGDLSSWTDEMIAHYAQFSGDAHQFVSLAERHGWLESRLIHDWLDYAGRYLESKYRTANPEKLRSIWVKHGRQWDSKSGSQTIVRLKTDCSPSKDRPPNLTNLTKPTHPPTPPPSGGGDDGIDPMTGVIPLEELKPPTPEQRAEHEATAFARNWICSFLPSFIRAGNISILARLITRIGKDAATAKILAAAADKAVNNPFAWVQAVLDRESAGKSIEKTKKASERARIARIAEKYGEKPCSTPN